MAVLFFAMLPSVKFAEEGWGLDNWYVTNTRHFRIVATDALVKVCPACLDVHVLSFQEKSHVLGNGLNC